MFESKSFSVVDESGFVGTLDAPARFLDNRAEKVIRLDGGGELSVRSEDLKVQPDGTFFLMRRSEKKDKQSTGASSALPATATPDRNERSPVHGAAPHQTDSPERAAEASACYYSDDYEIERVPIGRILDASPENRQEGDTLVLPVVEEVLVYQKKMLLKEEVRITRRRKPVDEVRKIEQPAPPPNPTLRP